MPRYFYKAKSFKGEEKSGFMEVNNVHQLAQILRKDGLILIRAVPEEKAKRKFEISLPFRGVSLKEKMFFTRNLQVMISAGLPLPRAIRTLSAQAKSKKFKKVLLEIEREIIRGRNFSDTLSSYPNIFSELFQSMVKIGEETGNLEEALKIMARQMEKENELRSKLIGAMIYPAVIICAMIGVGILMLIMVVPKLASAFEELNIELPITTKLIIAFANFLMHKWYFAIIILVFLIFLFLQILKIKSGKKFIDKFTLKVPIISPIVRNTNSAYTVRTLGSLISAGVPLPRSLEIISKTLGNIYYRNAMNEAVKRVRKGEKLSKVLESYKDIYPLTVIQMIAVGEETGETSNILEKLAEFYEAEVANATKNLVSLIEPLVMIVIGGAVGFFAISMIQPIYSMLGAL